MFVISGSYYCIAVEARTDLCMANILARGSLVAYDFWWWLACGLAAA